MRAPVCKPMPKPLSTRAATQARARAFLAAYRRTCSIHVAARAAKVNPRAHYRWLLNEQYAAAFEKAKVVAGDYLESVAVKRASLGWQEPVYYQGKRCGMVRRFDGGLMQFLLRGAKPDKYTSRVELGGKEGAPIESRLEVVFVNAKPAALIEMPKPA
jgi:hypothetical protein